MSENREHFYHYELDILRFFAFFLVYLWHVLPQVPGPYAKLPLPPAIPVAIAAFVVGGRFGVDLFFALSSYLITELLLREFRARGTIDIKAFYARRVLRIWPLYLTAVILGPPVLHWLDPKQHFGTAYLLGFLFFAGNWICAFRGWPESGLGPLWSVSIEEQFYLAWPLVVKHFGRYLHWICIGLIGVSCLTRYVLAGMNLDYTATWCNTFARLDPIAAGALLAISLRGRSLSLALPFRLFLTAAGLSLIVLSGWKGDLNGPASLWSYGTVTIGCVAMIAGILQPSGGNLSSRGPITRFFVYLGRISYGLYVFHLMAIQFTVAPSSSVKGWASNLVSSFLLTFLLAAISYRFLETPFLRLKQRFTYVSSTPAAS